MACGCLLQAKHFLRLPVPYCAVWVASHAKLHAFMDSPQWTKKEGPWEVRQPTARSYIPMQQAPCCRHPACPAPAPHDACMHAAQVRAMGAGGLQFVDVPEGFWSAALVPYSAAPDHPALNPAAAIYHLTNKYCAENTQSRQLLRKWERRLLCTIGVERYITT